MKKILTLLLILVSLNSFAQDTTYRRSGKLTLRLNDWEFIAQTLRSDVNTVALFDSIKVRLRPPTIYPSQGTDLVTVDSVVNIEAKTLAGNLHRKYHSSNRAACERVFTAIRAMNADPTHWLNRALDDMSAAKDADFANDKATGKSIYKR
jgi:hypothetical protein